MKHALMLELQATHAYSGGISSDVVFVPTPETVTLLRNHRCPVRYEPGKAKIVTSIEPTGEATLPLPKGATLEFALEMQGVEFVNQTDMAEFEALLLPLYTNQPLGDQNKGELTLVEDPILVKDPVEGLKKRRKKRPHVIANVEIVLPSGTPRDAAFHLTFRAKRAFWAYYCITKVSPVNNVPESEALNIKDTSLGSNAIVFGAANRKMFDITTAASELEKDPLAALLVRQNPNLQCWRLLSDEPIALRAEPRRGLELRLGNDPISSKLPNPPARNTTVITGDDSSSAITAQVHIIRYISKT